ncbi:hypothetical protein [Senegalia massiliensis]|uniref:hypothetical protein n=1 Tax=Senegalia massiliensis TaxID=1720316 RepID=UPI0010305B24|nr:hypothetical protein [Senegalia massiliensis]
MKKKIGVLIFFLVISVMLSACTDDNEDVENAKVEELEERIYELENKNEEYEKNQKELAKGLFRYELSIGDEEILNSEITTDKKEFSIILSERYPNITTQNEKLNEIIKSGKISGNHYNEHIKSLTPKPNEETMTDGTIVTAFHYIYKDLKVGDTIKIEITDQLKERLGFNSNTVEITVE